MRRDHPLANDEKLSIEQYLSAKHLRVAPSNATAPIDNR